MWFLSGIVALCLSYRLGSKIVLSRHEKSALKGNLVSNRGKIQFRIIVECSLDDFFVVYRRSRLLDFLKRLGLLQAKPTGDALIDETVYIDTESGSAIKVLETSVSFQRALLDLLKSGVVQIQRGPKGLEVFFSHKLDEVSMDKSLQAAKVLSDSLSSYSDSHSNQKVASYFRRQEGMLWAGWGYICFCFFSTGLALVYPFGRFHLSHWDLGVAGLVVGVCLFCLYSLLSILKHRSLLGLWKLGRSLISGLILVPLMTPPALAGLNSAFDSGEIYSARFKILSGSRRGPPPIKVTLPNGRTHNIPVSYPTLSSLTARSGTIDILMGVGHLGFEWYEVP